MTRLAAPGRALLALVGGVVLTLLSSARESQVRAVYPEIAGCETGCAVAGGGWPAAYLADHPGISAVGSVSLLGAVTGDDRLRILPFLIALSFWTAATGALPLIRARAVGARWA